MRGMVLYHKAIGIMVMGILLTLLVQAAAADSNSITVTGVVLPPGAPDADFTASPTSGTAPLVVQFTDNSTGILDSWSWDFGDGGVSTGQNPVHTFGPGLYTVALTATNTGGSTQKVRVGFITAYAPPSPPSGGGGDSGDPGDSGAPAAGAQQGQEQQQQQEQQAPVEQIQQQEQQQQQQEQQAPVEQVQQQEQQQQQAVAEPVAGLAEVAVSEGFPVGFEGMSYNAEGAGGLSIDTAAAEGASATISVTSTEVSVYQHGSPGVLITFYGEQFRREGKFIKGKVKKADFVTDPLIVNATGGVVSGSIRAVLTALTQHVTIENTISGNLTDDTTNRFRTVMAQNNLPFGGTAYTFTVRKGNLTSTGAANITLTVPSSWVDRNGGKDAIRIARISEITGTTELIQTVYLGMDKNNDSMTFRGDSPNGTSVFGMLTAKATAEKQQEQPNVTLQPFQKPAIVTDIGMFAWLLGITKDNPVVVGLLIVILAVLGYFGWYKRRL